MTHATWRDRAVKELRHRIVSSTPELQERALMKLAHLTEAITGALEQRGTPPGAASLAAARGTAVLTHGQYPIPPWPWCGILAR